jgi:hypothetical protein
MCWRAEEPKAGKDFLFKSQDPGCQDAKIQTEQMQFWFLNSWFLIYYV